MADRRHATYFVEHGGSRRLSFEERVECNGHGRAHDPNKPGKDKVGYRQPVPNTVVEEPIVAT
jgi:hypothetical protein